MLIEIFFSVILSIVINMILEGWRYDKMIEYDRLKIDNELEEYRHNEIRNKLRDLDKRIRMLESNNDE